MTNQNSPQDFPAPSGRIEAARRILLAVGFFGALWTGLNYTPELFSVGMQDFGHDKVRKAQQPFCELYGKMSLEEFIADRTKDRIIWVEGTQWKEFFDGVEAACAGRGGPEWDRRFGSSYCSEHLYFRPDEKPVNELAGKVTGEHGFSYLGLKEEGKTRYLTITHISDTDLHNAPWAVSRPMRQWSVGFLLVGLLGYIFLPWPKHPAGAVRYSLIRAGILPDIAGLLVAGVFFAMPILVLSGGGGPKIGGSPLDFQTGAGYFTLIFWAIGAIAASLLVVAASYCSYQVLVLPDGLRCAALSGLRQVPFSEIASVQPIEYRPPRWLMIVAALSRNASLMGLSMDYQSGIGVSLKDGGTWRFWFRGLFGGETLVSALHEAGVKIAPELSEMIPRGKRARRGAAGEGATSPSRQWKLQVVFGALAVALCVALWQWLNVPAPAHRPPVPLPPAPDPNVLIEQDRILREMGANSNAQKAALERAKTGPPAERAAALKECQELQSKFEDLRKQFDDLSKPKSPPQE